MFKSRENLVNYLLMFSTIAVTTTTYTYTYRTYLLLGTSQTPVQENLRWEVDRMLADR